MRRRLNALPDRMRLAAEFQIMDGRLERQAGAIAARGAPQGYLLCDSSRVRRFLRDARARKDADD
jgi:hypothetical protein